MRGSAIAVTLVVISMLAGCPRHAKVGPGPATVPAAETETKQPAGDGGGEKAGEAGPAGEDEVVQRPVFSPSSPPPCESHTACYLQAKKAYETGERAGYLLALENCEYYRGRYQLEKFYGLCLLMLADVYRHLNNFAESQECYRKFLETNPEDTELALQARKGLEEVRRGAKKPEAYRRYLEALSLLVRYNNSKERKLLLRARKILLDLEQKEPGWFLAEQVESLLEQIEKLAPAGAPKAESEAPAGT